MFNCHVRLPRGFTKIWTEALVFLLFHLLRAVLYLALPGAHFTGWEDGKLQIIHCIRICISIDPPVVPLRKSWFCSIQLVACVPAMFPIHHFL